METDRKKSFFIETYGCQMNEYDSGIVRSILEEAGYHPVDDPERAGLILLNTCAVREKAHERIYGRLQALSYLKKRNSHLRFGLLGCMAQNLKEELIGPGRVDFVVGPDNYRELPEILDEAKAPEETNPGENSHAGLVRTILSGEETYQEIRPSVVKGPTAYLAIMRGCNNYCTFCVVPYTRGKERSRSPESILDEIQSLQEQSGVKEVTLLGQNVNSYRYGSDGFVELIRLILDRTDLPRIRFTSPHPHDFPEPLLELMASSKRFVPHIHLPLQSGSSAVLKRMRRDYDAGGFLRLVKDIRSIVPGVSLTTDLIVGFCGETDPEYRETLDLVETIGFDAAFMFKYSERKGTVAARIYPDDVPEEVKLQRLDKLIQLQNRISGEKNRGRIGGRETVLVEGPSRRTPEDWMGRSAGNQTVAFPVTGQESVGDLVEIRITGATSRTLRGERILIGN